MGDGLVSGVIRSSGAISTPFLRRSTWLADQLQEPAAGMVVLGVGLEMFGQVVDALGEDRDLNFRGAGVCFVLLVVADEGGLLVFRQCHLNLHARPSSRIAELPSRRIWRFLDRL